MYFSRVTVKNFRNFSELDVALSGNVVVVGENRVGKSNLLYGLRLIFDPTVPDSTRHLEISDFWDGLDELARDTKIQISVEIKEFEDDLKILALLTDFRLDDDPNTVRLTYEFRPKLDLQGEPASKEDYEFLCYGGESEAKKFGYEIRKRLAMEVLPALRDSEGDLSTWQRSPLRPLIEGAFSSIDTNQLEEIGEAIQEATSQVSEFDEVRSLEDEIAELFARMSGPRQDIQPRLGFAPTDITRLHRNIRLLIDEGARGIADASLGSANLVFLSLKTLAIQELIKEGARDHTVLAIEEPEAHLHPHLQRSVYSHVFEAAEEDTDGPLSVFLTTHSPHIASVAPIRSILLLREADEAGTIGCSTASLELSEDEADDLSRYLDVTRAEILFARGVILVEGDSERFLIPEFAQGLERPLDHLGISVCSVSGTNFTPYVKFLTGLGIPFSVVTDWDPKSNGNALGFNRSLRLVECIERQRTGEDQTRLVAELRGFDDLDDYAERCAEFGVFINDDTLEVDLFEAGFNDAMIETLREEEWSTTRTGWIDSWEDDPDSMDRANLLKLIEVVGKGRFAQRLIAHIGDTQPPDYIRRAIEHVADRV